MFKSLTPILFSLFILSIQINSFSQTFRWSAGVGNNEADTESRITVDEHSNLYATGSYKGTIDFDPGKGAVVFTSGGTGTLNNAYITKLDSTGNLVWVKVLTGDVYQYGSDIVYDPSGFIYVFGYYIGTCDFDPGPGQHTLSTPNFTYDAFILKLDVNGNFIWVAPVGENGNEYGGRITLDPNGNVIASGIFTGTSDFDPGPNQTIFTVTGLADTYVVKYSSNGEFMWAKNTKGTFNASVTGIKTDAVGNIYLCGAFDDQRDFIAGSDSLIISATGLWDIYVMKLSGAGNFTWVKHLGNDNDNWPRELVLDNDNFLYITGYFSGTLDFDPGMMEDIHTAINSDFFIWKLNADGQLIWTIPFGGISYEQGRSIALDQQKNIYVTGSYAETVDFDPGPDEFNLTSTGNNDEDDAFALKLHADGSFAWAYSLGGLADDIGFGIEPGVNQDLFMTGTFNTTAGFRPASGVEDSLVSKGLTDVYFVRWKQCEETDSVISPFSCGYYVSPSGKYTWNESGTYYDTIPNRAGCDSIITIQLQISDLGLSITQSGDTLFADGGVKGFYWLDCDDNYSLIAEGPEFTPTHNGNYAVAGSGFVCTDTSACFAFVMTAILDNQYSGLFELYPNPSHHHFEIDLHDAYPDVQLAIFNSFGIQVYNQNFYGQEKIQVANDFAAGLYLILVSQGEKRQMFRVVVE